MILPRVFLAGVVAIALLFLGSVAFLSWSVRYSSAPALQPAPVRSAAAPAPLTLAGDGGPGEKTAATNAPPAEVPPPGARRAKDLMPPPRRHALVSFRREIIAGFAELERRVAACEPRGVQPRTRGGLSEASFLLSVESVAGGVRILEAQPESRGSASDAEVACARAALRGHLIPASSAEPGRQWQLRFSPKSSI
jgi:hypothetical protein